MSWAARRLQSMGRTRSAPYRQTRECVGCGITFEAHTPGRRYCCGLCKRLYQRTHFHCPECGDRRRNLFPTSAEIQERVDKHLPCRIAFLEREGRNDTCRCPECKERKGITEPLPKKASAQMRRTPGHHKHRAEVLERDEYICQICGEETNPQAHVGDPDYPNLDHIISVADGGDDSPDNLQTAHRRCNIKRALWW